MITTSATCKHNLSSHPSVGHTWSLRPPPANTTYHHTWASVGHTWSLRPPPANTTYHHTFCWSYMITTSATCKHNLSSHWASVGHTWSLRPPPANTTYHHTFCWSYMITTSATCKHNLSSHLGFCWSYMITTSATCKHNLSSHLLLVIHDHYVRHLQTQPIITPGLLLVIHDHYVRHLQTQPIITPGLLLVIHDHYVRHLQTQPIITPKLLLVIHDHYVRHLQTQPIITPSVGHTWSLRPPPANTTYHHTFCWSYMITTSATCKHNLSSHLLLVIHDHYVRHLQTQPIITPSVGHTWSLRPPPANTTYHHTFCWSYMITTSATCKHNLSSHLLLVIHDHYVRHLQTQPIITPSVGHTWSLRPPPANTTYHHTFCWSYMITTSATCKHNLSSHLGFCWSYMITTSATCKHNLSSHLLLVIHDHYVRHLQTQPIITPSIGHTWSLRPPPANTTYHHTWASVGHTWSLRPPPANTTYHHT